MDTEVEAHGLSTGRESRGKLDPDSREPAATACFDCNICLDFAVDPVVTLCGHLYCWPCIYKWLQLESTTLQPCPVCKAAVSLTTLVPLYGRGYNNGSKGVYGADHIPRRPSTPLTATAAQHRHQRRQRGNFMVSSSSTTTRLLPPTMLGGTAVAVLPWLMGDEWMESYPHHLLGSGDSPRLRQQEMQARISLHRISVFLFCCVVLCLLVF